jgi:hypothetical protein
MSIMDVHQIEQKILQNTKELPVEALNEILDFVLFIKNKNSKKKMKDDLSFFRKNELDHLEMEFKDYKEIYPHES